MRVARSVGVREVRVEDDPEPVAGEGEVVARVLACGVCGSDVLDAWVAQKVPAVLGHELCAEVAEVGAGVARRGRRRPGRRPPPRAVRRVPALPARPRDALRPVPGDAPAPRRVRRARPRAGRPRRRAARRSTGSTPSARRSSSRSPACCARSSAAACGAGDSLLVVGCGTSGLLAVAAAHARAVEAVWVREPRPERLERALALGAERHGNELVDVAIVCTTKPAGDRGRLRGGRARRRAVPLRAARPRPGPRPRRPRALRRRGRRVRVVLRRAARHARRARAHRDRAGRPALAHHPPPAARGDRPRARARRGPARRSRRSCCLTGLMRAAVLHGPGDLRVEDVDEPAGDVLVRVEAATACGTDVKMLRHGHRVLGPTRAASATRPPACASTPASACSSATRSRAAPARRAAAGGRRSAAR